MEYDVFDSFIDGVFVIDRERKLVYFNESFAAICGVPGRRIKAGTSCSDLIQFVDTELFCMPGGRWGETEPTPYKEVSFKTLKGREGMGQVAIRPDPHSPGARWIIVIHDVTLEVDLHRKYRQELREKEHLIENLERMVEERTAELRAANTTIHAMVDSLGQGFMMLDREGWIHPICSKAAETLFGMSPAGKKFWEVLRLDSGAGAKLSEWCKFLFEERLPFKDMARVGPKVFYPEGDRHVGLEYHPVRGSDKRVEGIVVVATDRTAEVRASREAERERHYAEMVIRIAKNRWQFKRFLTEAFDLIAEIREGAARAPVDVDRLMALAHTLKGNASAFSLRSVTGLVHEFEDRLNALRSSEEALLIAEIRDGAKRIEDLLRSVIEENRAIIGPRDVAVDSSSNSSGLVEEWTEYYDDVIRSVAAQLGKKVRGVGMGGNGTHHLPAKCSKLLFALVHALRNAVDHGIEMPSERVAVGKPSEGTVEIAFEWMALEDGGKSLRIRIADDGRGMDEAIARKVFRGHFSTAKTVTEISGRGTGMGAILSAARHLGGTAEIKSRKGRGTELIVVVPGVD